MCVETTWRVPCVEVCPENVPAGDGKEPHAGPPRRILAAGRPRPELYRRICTCIESNLGDERFGSASLTRLFAVSRSTLYRLFGGEGGVDRYIRRRRLERARRHLMDDPTCGITWLLYELGFASDRQFQRAFLARYGISPAQWRKHCREALSESGGARNRTRHRRETAAR